MSAFLDDFNKVRRVVETLQREADQAAGAITEILKQAQEKFKCKDLKEMENLLKELEVKERKLMKQFGIAMKEFRKKIPASLKEKYPQLF